MPRENEGGAPQPASIDLTFENLLDGLATEIRGPGGPGAFTRSFNQAFVAQFRANGGIVPGELAQAEFLLLTTTGATSGKPRTTPLTHFSIDGRILVVASMGGAPNDPGWYRNLLADPTVIVEFGGEAHRARAVVIEGAERDRLFAEIVAQAPLFGEYQRRASRTIPLVELRPTDPE